MAVSAVEWKKYEDFRPLWFVACYEALLEQNITSKQSVLSFIVFGYYLSSLKMEHCQLN